jgi:hypothetical protein
MGSFYVNFTTRGPDQAAIVQSLQSAKRKSFVGPTLQHLTVYFDEQADTQDDSEIKHVGEVTSRGLKSPVLAVLNHDDDILAYWLFENGKLIDEYCSWPGYFNGGPETPSGGDADKLCAAFAAAENVQAVDEVLHKKEFDFAMDRHMELAKLLRFPKECIGVGYQFLEDGEIPNSANFVQVG